MSEKAKRALRKQSVISDLMTDPDIMEIKEMERASIKQKNKRLLDPSKLIDGRGSHDSATLRNHTNSPKLM